MRGAADAADAPNICVSECVLASANDEAVN